MKLRIYIDTSIVGGYYDEEFKEDTIKLFERFENDEIIFVVSDLLDLELLNAPQRVRDLLTKYSLDKFERIANIYIKEKVVGETSITDCRHIALATINKVDVLSSWRVMSIVKREM